MTRNFRLQLINGNIVKVFCSLQSKPVSYKVTKIRNIKRVYCIIDDKQLTCNSKIGFHQYPLNVGFTQPTFSKSETVQLWIAYYIFVLTYNPMGLRPVCGADCVVQETKIMNFVEFVDFSLAFFWSLQVLFDLSEATMLSWMLCLEGELWPEFYGAEMLVNMKGKCVVMHAIKAYGSVDL